MADKTFLYQFKGGSGQSLSTFGNNTKIINWYSFPTPEARSPFELRPREGSSIDTTLSPTNGQGCRGLFRASTGSRFNSFRPSIVGVFGDSVFRFNESGVPIFVGNVRLGSENITFAESQEQATSNVFVYVCDGVTIFKFDIKADDDAISSTYAEIPYIPYVNGTTNVKAVPNNISYYNYRLVMSCKNSNQWFYSGLNNDLFNDSHFYTTEFKNDQTTGLFGTGGNLWTLNQLSYEIWTRTGVATNPFATPMGSQGYIGCASVDSVTQVDSDIYWLGQGSTVTNAIFRGGISGQVTRISTTEIEQVIKNWQFKNQVKAMSYRNNNATHIVFTSTLDNQTISYCVEADEWSECSSSVSGVQRYWDVRHMVVDANGESFHGTFTTNDYCKFTDIGTDFSDRLVTRLFSSPIIIENLYQMNLKEITFDIETGMSNTYLDEVPELFVEVSKDGGKTFGERRLLTLGKRGDYKKQVSTRGFGITRNLVIRIGSSSVVPVTLYQLRLRYSSLRS